MGKKKGVVFLLFVMLSSAVLADELIREQVYDSVSLLKPAVMSLDDAVFPLTRVEVFTTETKYNVNLKASTVDEEEVSIADPLYRLFRLESDLARVDINATSLKFRVTDNYLLTNDLSKENVYLLKYDDGEWVAVKTEYLERAGNFHYYKSITDGIYMFMIAAKQQDIITIGRISEINVLRGKTASVVLKITNNGVLPKEYIISVREDMPLVDWQVESNTLNREFSVTIDKKRIKRINIMLLVGNEALLGAHTFTIAVVKPNEEVEEFPLRLNIKAFGADTAGADVVSIEKLFEELEEGTNKIRIRVTNYGQAAKRYVVEAEGIELFGSYYLDPGNIVFVEAGETKNIYINIKPLAGVEASNYDFSVSVKSEARLISKEEFNVYAAGKEDAGKNTEAIILAVSAVLFLLALVMFIKARRKH